MQWWQWEIFEYSSYSPGMNPCDSDLFPELKEPLRGKGFQGILPVLLAVGHSFADINNEHLASGLQRLPEYM